VRQPQKREKAQRLSDVCSTDIGLKKKEKINRLRRRKCEGFL